MKKLLITAFAFFFGLNAYSQCFDLVWSDEFNVNGLPDATKWSYDVGGHGWGNNELQYYTDKRTENARVADGKLIIEMRKEAYNGKNYTSARLITKNKGDWKYGKIVVRAKLPKGKGTWPAIWMLPTEWKYGNGGWPDNGEIDNMEHVGYDPGRIHGTIHCKKYNHSIGTQKGASKVISDAQDAFHDYAILWSENKIEWFVDDQLYFTVLNEGKGWEYWPFDKAYHLILNIAMGGNWGGAQGIDESITSATMEVDYVRVYSTVNAITIAGTSFVQANEKGVQYSCTALAGATKYEWTVPEGAKIISGAGTDKISVDFGTAEGNVTVKVSFPTCPAQEIVFPVQLTAKPGDGGFKLEKFTNDEIPKWLVTNSTAYSFDVSQTNGTMQIAYNVSDPNAWPKLEYRFDKIYSFTDLPVINVWLKSNNLSKSAVVRIDLKDGTGLTTNATNVFEIRPVKSDGKFNMYQFSFKDNWMSNSPYWNKRVNSNAIQGFEMFVNYGVFGKANVKDTIWVEKIAMVSQLINSNNEIAEFQNLRLFPNPTANLLNIEAETNFDQIIITDITGKTCFETQIDHNNQTVISVENLRSGIYMLSLFNKQIPVSRNRFSKL
ncbi:MAG TPA: glycoside hydrolase family 1 [Bacteroidales bacterium]|nr:glycoside hydrolase family 1 [Bacteroidales bacterium]